MRVLFALILAVVVVNSASVWAQDRGALNVYIDADFSTNWESAQSIEQGLRAAFQTMGGQAAGYQLNIVPLDHRTNARRSINNLRQFDADPDGIAVVGGMHSPVYINHLDEILDREVPLLLAWSAAGVLTRQRMGGENWIFRLSVDDFQVGPFLAREMSLHRCQRIGLVVLDNAWGRGNLASVSANLRDLSLPHVYETTIATEIGPARAGHVAAELSTLNVDCLGLVGNSHNSAALMMAVDELGLDLEIFSHWGLLSGGFAELVPHEVRTRLGLRIVQTCGLNDGRHDAATLRQALSSAAQLGWSYESLSDVPAPAGFVHGFDLGLILMAALDQATQTVDWSEDPDLRRYLLREALEALDQPIRGILRHYHRPFGEVSDATLFNHEALSGEDLCFAQLDERGRLVDLAAFSPLNEAALGR